MVSREIKQWAIVRLSLYFRCFWYLRHFSFFYYLIVSRRRSINSDENHVMFKINIPFLYKKNSLDTSFASFVFHNTILILCESCFDAVIECAICFIFFLCMFSIVFYLSINTFSNFIIIKQSIKFRFNCNRI